MQSPATATETETAASVPRRAGDHSLNWMGSIPFAALHVAAIAGVFGSADALAEKVPVFHALGSLAGSNALAFGLFAALGLLLYGVALRHE